MLGWSLSALLIYLAPGPLAGMKAIHDYFDAPAAIVLPAVSAPHLPRDAIARDYLNVANGVVNAYVKSNARCKEFTQGTLERYAAIVVADGRPDLLDDVRIAASVSDPEPHVWLQVREERWNDYDPMQYTPPLTAENAAIYSEQSRVLKEQFEAPTEVQMVGIPGTTLALPRAEFIFHSGGYLAFKRNVDTGSMNVILGN